MDALVDRSPVSARPLRVLVIDDDQSVSAAIQAILSRRNGQTDVANRAHAGIHALTASRHDVVLIDLFMPGLSGLDTITYIRRGSTIPIVAMSGFRLRHSAGSDERRDFFQMAMERGASSWLRKPFSPQELLSAIDHGLSLSSLEKHKQ